jgi:ribosomal protein S18 acetylase RimI-like enzyme
MHELITQEEFVSTYITPFSGVEYFYSYRLGYIAWRRGTGDNIELLHIRSFQPGKGYGRFLFYTMLRRLKADPPYHSVFGFTRVGNAEARAFYGALGFNLSVVDGLYAEGQAVLFWQQYTKLTELFDAYYLRSSARPSS